MKKQLILGVLVSVVLVYLSVRGIRFEEVAAGFRQIRCAYLLPVLALMTLMQILRAWRWGVILAPLERIAPGTLFSVSNVGFLAIVALPARLGEFARPYLITRKSGVRMTSAMGTIFAERVLDSLTVLLIAVTVLMFVDLPPWLIRSSIVLFFLMTALLGFMVVLILRREVALGFLSPLLNRIPPRYRDLLTGLIHHFIDGFGVIRDGKRLLFVAGSTVLIWFVDALAIFLLFFAFDFPLSFVAAIVVMVILIIGIAIPTAPGFVGNWHYFCMLGLTFYGIPKADALTYAVVYHFLSIGIVVVLGLIYLPFNRFTLSDLTRQVQAFR